MKLMISKTTLAAMEAEIGTKKICLFGDVCVDLYWEADMTRSELSRETPHFPLPVVGERYYPGAGGNVAANLAALGVEVRVVSVCGDDWRAMLLRQSLADSGVRDIRLIAERDRFTNAYCKPLRRGISDLVYEDPRLDFENNAFILPQTEDALEAALFAAAEDCDALCVADQFRCGCVTPRLRDALRYIAGRIPVVADSRNRIDQFAGCILKPNEVECIRAVYGAEAGIPGQIDEVCRAADTLAARMKTGVLCTLGDAGSYYTLGENGIRTPSVPATGNVDICGAGDTSLAAFTAALALGAPPSQAAAFAGAASAVTVRKIGVTGTASFDEIRKLLFSV